MAERHERRAPESEAPWLEEASDGLSLTKAQVRDAYQAGTADAILYTPDGHLRDLRATIVPDEIE
ncbi:hypothetical protein [Alicyclobacillus acidocaldarius]|uniref:Uncharacterized protein n=1 Tax=Alicyclobacillus acidocaldarius subsp. acidocaldarius (strain ATCC 27009 / DSM 446 / BCRC 14685 / JCM 5260 / KCTC 1825 / NBRC 15652 / NCIMB 11725 / NRRL B-14509 / 104-IA) TaxID=521098 RepID=C8WT94_ALIAD|nr:hypothetical protein [Alicyclobacillus acidocaldarius]ACV59608.1 hypothetical protein Aaci_2604 [Alicyclobacillus acidocaldarius subsp. acidocaldarius DSM 446]